MKSIAVAAALASALLTLRATAAAPEAGSYCAEPRAAAVVAARSAAAGAPAPESPAAAFERMLAPRTPVTGPAPVGMPADALTRAFNAVLWNAPNPAIRDASTRVASAQ